MSTVRFARVCLAVVLLVATVLPVGCSKRQEAAGPDTGPMADWLAQVKQQYAGTTVTISAASHPSIEAFRQMIGDFERATGITVEWDVVEENSLASKQLMEYQAGTGRYDLVMDSVEGNAPFASLGALLPLDDYIATKTPAWYDWEDIMPAYRDLFNFNGKQWAVPFAGETVFLMYRKDLFEQNGTQVPKTWDELRQTAAFYSAKGNIAGVTMRARRGWEFTYIWSVFIFPFGGKIIDPATGKPAFTEPGVAQSLEFLKSLKQYAPVGIESFSFPEAWESFSSGKAAMAVEATAAAPVIEDPSKSQVAGKVGYAPLPAGPAGAYTGVWGWGFAISSQSKHPDAAWDVLLWLTSKANQARYLELGGTVSRRSGLEDPALQAKYPYFPACLEALNQAEALAAKGLGVVPKVPYWLDLSDVIGTNGSEAFVGQLSVDQAIKNIQAQAEKLASGQ